MGLIQYNNDDKDEKASSGNGGSNPFESVPTIIIIVLVCFNGTFLSCHHLPLSLTF